MNPSLKFSRPVSAQLIKWVLKTSWNSPVVWRNFSCDLRENRCGGAERRNGEKNFMGKQDSWLLMANQFSFCNEKVSRFSSEDMTPAPRGKMRCVTRKIIYIITTFIQNPLLAAQKNFSWMHLMVKRRWKFAWDLWPSRGWLGSDVGSIFRLWRSSFRVWRSA